MPDTFTIAHFSDVHLSPVAGFTPRHWNAKRALGYVNWRRKRRHVHVREVADRIAADVERHAPGHIAITGDLVNIGLPTEYEAAAHWLATVGTPQAVSLVPGNHDIYTRLRRDPGIERWRPYMTCDDWGATITGDHAAFPYVRKVGPAAIVGLCSAVETAPAIATGRLGPAQRAAAARIFDRLACEPLLKLVMIHHPPLPGLTRPRHALTDAAELADLLGRSCADVVLHGHTHLPTVHAIERTGGQVHVVPADLSDPAAPQVHVVGVGSASAAIRRGHEPLAQYNLLRIRGGLGKWRVELERRGLAAADGEVVELERRTLG
jgi:3',5'-cyclic AMP phosphodiesterase CpdA